MKCPKCGAEDHKVYYYKNSPLLACPEMPDNEILSYEMKNEKHWTFPEDDSPDNQAGVGIFNFNFMFKDAKDIILWHDLITKAGSFAQKVGITNKRVAEHFREMLQLRNEELAKKGKISGLRGIAWKLSGRFVQVIHRFFYEGRLK